MNKIFTTRKLSYFIAALFLVISYSCQPDDENLPEATFPDIAEVFIDTFSAGLQYAAFGTSKVTAFDVDTDITFEGTAAMRFDIPNTSDPEGGFAGGVFTTGVGRNLTDYNVLTFYARASKGETINQIGFGLTFEGEVFRTQVNGIQVGTAWQKYFIPIPNSARLTQERGMLWIAEAADDGSSYQLWIDEVKFENLNTIIQESAEILNGVDQVTGASAGNTITIDGTSATYNLPSGILQSLTTTAAYFDYTSSNESVATVNEFGVVSVLSDDGSSVISATLNGLDANGSITLMDVDASGNVDDSENTEIMLPLGFESATLGYNPVEFGGAPSAVSGNPQVGGLNNSGNVLRTQKVTGSETFAGIIMDLDVSVDFSESEQVSALVFAPAAGTTVLLGFEDGAIGQASQVAATATTTVANEWQELTFDYTGTTNTATDYNRLVLIYNNGTAGDDSVYFIDDIQLTDGDGGGGGGNEGDNLLENGDFEQGMVTWFGNAFNVQEDGGNSFNLSDNEVSGNPFDVNLSHPVALEAGITYTLSFDASTSMEDGSRTIIAGIGLNEGDFASATEIVTVTSETQTYTLTLTPPAGSTNSRVLFDLGSDGGVLVLDNVVLTTEETMNEETELLTNGDFEQGMITWFGNAFNVQEDGGNSFNLSDNEVSGNPFDVNLSHPVTLEAGVTYTLSFDASTSMEDGSRTIIAGIGLNEGDFAAATEVVTITSETQTYTLTLTPPSGSTNSRALFDLGADGGVLVLDNVSLVQN
ncbi:carbohydrate binding domain-containing protein [uncultured Dokdonia sp.]|uniref:carbohydrate binding domain-containing protein n=1 Tax=uncultured Dokdonia sp. TaxID=575653 RepID=UPI002639963D|nr:carbohydrate binding domain-containing protein [uncultured Dokdonia sp.]